MMCSSSKSILSVGHTVDKEIDKINEWNEKVQKMLADVTPDITANVTVLEYYIKSLKVHLNECRIEDWKTLIEKVLAHLPYLNRIQTLTSAKSTNLTPLLRLYEEILNIYVTIELNIVAESFRRKDERLKENAKHLEALGQKIITTLSNSFDVDWKEVNIVHSLLKVKYDRRSPACVSIMKFVYHCVLFTRTIVDTDDITLCGSYLLFCKYKKFIRPDEYNRMTQTFLGRYKKHHSFLNDFQMLREILCLEPGPLAEQTSSKRVHIVNNYFKYIKELPPSDRLTKSAKTTGSKSYEPKTNRINAFTQKESPPSDYKRIRTKCEVALTNTDNNNSAVGDVKLKLKDADEMTDEEAQPVHSVSEKRIIKFVDSTSIGNVDRVPERKRHTDVKTIFLVHDVLDNDSTNISSSTPDDKAQILEIDSTEVGDRIDHRKLQQMEIEEVKKVNDRFVDSTSISSTVSSLSMSIDAASKIDVVNQVEHYEMQHSLPVYSTNITSSVMTVNQSVDDHENENIEPVQASTNVTSTAEVFQVPAEEEMPVETIQVDKVDEVAEVFQAADSTNIPGSVQIIRDGNTMYVLRVNAANILAESIPSISSEMGVVQAVEEGTADETETDKNNLLSQLEEYISITNTSGDKSSFYEDENYAEFSNVDNENDTYLLQDNETCIVYSTEEQNSYSDFPGSQNDSCNFEFGYETPPKDPSNGEQEFHIETPKELETNMENDILTPENEVGPSKEFLLEQPATFEKDATSDPETERTASNKTISNIKVYLIKKKPADHVDDGKTSQFLDGSLSCVSKKPKNENCFKSADVVKKTKNQKAIKFNGTVMVRKFHFDDNEDYVIAEKSLLPTSTNKGDNEVSSTTKKFPLKKTTLISAADSTASILKKPKPKRIADLCLDMDIESAFAQLKRKRNKKPERRRKAFHVIKPKRIHFNGVKPGDPKIFNMQPIVELPKCTPSELIHRSTSIGFKKPLRHSTSSPSSSNGTRVSLQRTAITNSPKLLDLCLSKKRVENDFLSNDLNFYAKPEAGFKTVHPDILKEMHKRSDEEINLILESLKMGIETRLPLKKRRMALSEDFQAEDVISYPATPMISIAEVEALQPAVVPMSTIAIPEVPPVDSYLTDVQFTPNIDEINFNNPSLYPSLNFLPCTSFFGINP